MKVYKEGIVKTIKENEWQRYRELGFVKIGDETNNLDEAEEPTLDDLKAEADKLGIEYPANIGYNKLLQKINAKKAEE